MKICGIDPGLKGAIILTDGKKFFEGFEMPVVVTGKDKLVDSREVHLLLGRLKRIHGNVHIFLERAVSFGMGLKGAFNYGRGFEGITLAIEHYKLPLTMIEPKKWTAEMLEGTSAELKPKVRSAQAVQRLFPQMVKYIPQGARGKLHDGFVDALLIAGYGLRRYKAVEAIEQKDFF